MSLLSLQTYNTFGIPAEAVSVTTIDSESSAESLIAAIANNGVVPLVLGGGSNILLVGDCQRPVWLVRVMGCEEVASDDSSVTWRIGAGVCWHDLVMKAAQRNLYGTENLALIPGCVGAAPIQNIGAYGVEIGSVLVSVRAANMVTGEWRDFSKADCELGYRDSYFKSASGKSWLVTSITIRLSRRPIYHLNYNGLQSLASLAENGELAAEAVAQTVIKLRQSKLPNPADLGNAGSFFKNPMLDENALQTFLDDNPDCPYYPEPRGGKLSAAWLIEQSGWKGYRQGDVGVYPKHALVLVNYGHSSGEQIWALAQKIQQSVKDKFSVDLVPEVRIVGVTD